MIVAESIAIKLVEAEELTEEVRVDSESEAELELEADVEELELLGTHGGMVQLLIYAVSVSVYVDVTVVES